MNIRVKVFPYTGDQFEPFTEVMCRPSVGEYLKVPGRGFFVVRQIVITPNHYTDPTGAKGRGRIDHSVVLDMYVLADPAKSIDLPL